MRTLAKAAAIAVSAALALCLGACSSESQPSSDASGEEAAQQEHVTTREDVEPLLLEAAGKTFSSVVFKEKTETTATGPASNGAQQTQSIQTTNAGELDKSGEKPRMHMSYSAMSTMELGRMTYDMFIDTENLIVKQGEQLYVDAMTDEMLNSYADSVTGVITSDEIKNVLDMASDYKLTESEGETTVSVTVDADKLMESEEYDAAAMPENNKISTMVMSYTIGADGRFKTVRVMSSTSGSPTYRVHQTYQFSDYDNAALPEWPDLAAYVAEQSGIKTDENGRMYIVGDDGQVYYVSEIGDDGMIYYDTSGNASTSDTTYYYDTGGQTTNTGGTTEASTDGSSSDQGRAYITADDGTVHFLDEEGGRLIENEDGTRYFIDADGNFYFLSDE